jgi:CheY-like chemotaxis protein
MSEEAVPARILIVDDEPCIADLLSEMLQMMGYSATKCLSPAAALALLEREDFDVILSDFRMPQMNGDEFYNRAVAKRPELAPRMVFLTGDTSSEETDLFLRVNSKRHLNKPFDLLSVERLISEILGRPSQAMVA